MTVELLTRAGCAACAAARSELTRICAEMGVEFTEVDVDEAAEGGRPDVRAEFGDRLPVVLLDGDEHSYWEVDEPRLRADLAARR
ncbi:MULTISPECIES: glutaredoxin family protein [Gordonia]|uniref:glutaredoxin family protein n=1 Tax=Gordonia TaxID=2053 RepID=UPI001CFB1C5C|nr:MULTISPECIES: glutaredoxin family protein [unclassified Gordonia (in: high G+C Gram-positive bacteria)]MCZ4536591.1 glutaredoxin family protein [Gordonia terrae]UCZ89269.1 glutaredoxin family protein [Gordonia sp. WA4-43]WGJ86462.1 glutaredoxin family protein [Gordonia sp. SMJS1]